MGSIRVSQSGLQSSILHIFNVNMFISSNEEVGSFKKSFLILYKVHHLRRAWLEVGGISILIFRVFIFIVVSYKRFSY